MKTQPEIIQAGLDRKNWPARRLALHIGKTPQFIGNVLHGQRNVTLDDTIYAVADALDVNADDMFLAINRMPPDILDKIIEKPHLIPAIRDMVNRS